METLDISAARSGGHQQLHALLPSAAQPLAWWLALLVAATVAGYPGAALITPGAWLLAAVAGYSYAMRSVVYGLRPRLRFAALLGATVGLGLGLICAVVVLGWVPLVPHELPVTYGLLSAITVVGTIVGVPLSVLPAWAVRRRYRA